MLKSYQIFTDEEKELIRNAISKNWRINHISYSLTEKTEHQLDVILGKILTKHDQLDIKGSVYTCLKELAVNGTKANFKNVFFNINNIDSTDKTDFIKGTAEFKKALELEKNKEFGKKIYDAGYYLRISFDFSVKGLNIQVYNNSRIPYFDRERIKTKLYAAKSYESIADYYLDAFDDTEGAGLGLAMITIILKGMGIDIDNFNINVSDEGMYANLFFPFNNKLV